MLILLAVPLLGVGNRNKVGENGDFQPLYVKISSNNMVTVTINHQ